MQTLIRELKASLNGIETLERDPASYISEHFQELNRQVDLRREKLLLAIQNRSNQLIEEIEAAHQECLMASKAKSPITDSVQVCKMELDALYNGFDSFKIDGMKCEEILEKSKALKQRLEPMMEQYKLELLINQTFEFTTQDINIDQIFGSFEIKGVRILIVKYFNIISIQNCSKIF